MGLSVKQIAVGGFDDNFSYVVIDEDTKQAYVVDPSGELDVILDVIEEKELMVSGVLVTHTHHDHIDKLAELLQSYLVPVMVHESGVSMVVSDGPIQGLSDEMTIGIGSGAITVLHTPGHIDDAVCYFIPATEAADGLPKIITGDTLFVEGCGRVTAENVQKLYDSLQRLKTLPDDTRVYSGHDYGSKPVSTIAWEKEHNAYFRAKDLEEFTHIRLDGAKESDHYHYSYREEGSE